MRAGVRVVPGQIVVLVEGGLVVEGVRVGLVGIGVGGSVAVVGHGRGDDVRGALGRRRALAVEVVERVLADVPAQHSAARTDGVEPRAEREECRDGVGVPAEHADPVRAPAHHDVPSVRRERQVPFDRERGDVGIALRPHQHQPKTLAVVNLESLPRGDGDEMLGAAPVLDEGHALVDVSERAEGVKQRRHRVRPRCRRSPDPTRLASRVRVSAAK